MARSGKIHKFTCKFCGKEFLSDRTNAVYCSRSCSGKDRVKHDPWQFAGKNYEEKLDSTDDRPLTPDTRHIVKMWHELGDSPTQIALILNRKVSTIEAILAGEL